MDTKETLGNRIRKVREQNNLSMRAFAEAMEIGVQTLVRYEKAGNDEKESRYPPADFLQKILRFDPNVDPAWLLTGQNSGLLHFQQEMLERNIADIEAAETGERNREILTALYMTHHLLDEAHFHGRDLIQKILDLTVGELESLRQALLIADAEWGMRNLNNPPKKRE